MNFVFITHCIPSIAIHLRFVHCIWLCPFPLSFAASQETYCFVNRAQKFLGFKPRTTCVWWPSGVGRSRNHQSTTLYIGHIITPYIFKPLEVACSAVYSLSITGCSIFLCVLCIVALSLEPLICPGSCSRLFL